MRKGVHIVVYAPIKTKHKYVFTCKFRGHKQSFGFCTPRIIEHANVWDSVFPLMYLTRSGGPIYGTIGRKHVIKFEYPVIEEVANFFISKCQRSCGCKLTIQAPTFLERGNIQIPQQQMPMILAMGGGKDSRMLYGALSESGYEFESLKHGEHENGIQNLIVTKPIVGNQSECMMPIMTMNPNRLITGGSIGEVHCIFPWHRYYDLASPMELSRFNALLETLGLAIRFETPLSVVPYNITQKILFERYPWIAKHQHSTQPQEDSIKNLHVSLCKAYHGYDFQDHCSRELFDSMLAKWSSVWRRWTPTWDGDIIIHLEMMAIAYKMRRHTNIEVSSSWSAKWIDSIHEYLFPDVDKELLSIFRQYAKPYTGDLVIPTEATWKI